MNCLFKKPRAVGAFFLAAIASFFCLLAVAAPFSDHGNGTVTDHATGLMWMQCSVGQTWQAGSPASCIDTASTMIWQNALQAAFSANTVAQFGYADWRLPNLKELESLVDIEKSNPAIDPSAFPNTMSDYYWSSTSTSQTISLSSAWLVGFSDTYAGVGYATNGNARARLVRGGQYFGPFDALRAGTDPDTYTAASPGGGDITVVFTNSSLPNCGYVKSQYISVNEVPELPPTGVTFPHGLFDFATSLCDVGGAQRFTITYPTAIPEGAQYWKYGPTAVDATPHWYTLPDSQVSISADRKTWTITITDGGLGDDDLLANGAVLDQGGPGVPAGARASGVSVPLLPLPLVVLLAGIIGIVGVRRFRRF